MPRTPRRTLLAVLVAVVGVSVGAVASSARSAERGGDGRRATTVDDHNGSTGGEDRGGVKAGDDRGGAKAGDGRRGGRPGDDHGRGHRPDVYTVPGDAAFPEGIALDPRARRLFVSSTSDGTVFAGDVEQATLRPLAPGGADGRTTATGLKVDGRGRLFVAGGATGRAFVLSTADGRTLKVLDGGPRSGPTFINDVVLAGGFAYFTDSMRPLILRAATSGASIGELEPWLDLRGTPFVYRDGVNANGIASFARGAVLVVVQFNTGRLFSVDTRTKAVSEIDLGGDAVTGGDGLVADGSRLFVVRHLDGQITEVKLLRGRREGRIAATVTSAALLFPTTAVLDGNRLLVVNSQFHKRGGTPVLPFTVASVAAPDAIPWRVPWHAGR
jgi:sugar lactone lactonase YvrE